MDVAGTSGCSTSIKVKLPMRETGIVGDALVEAGRGRVRAVGAHQERVAIGCGAGDIGGGDGAVRSWLVLDDDALVERLSEMLRNDARNGVGGAAGTEWDDEGDRLVRILALQRTLHLCGGARGHGEQRGAGCDDHAKQTCHASSLPVAIRCYCGCRSPRMCPACFDREGRITDLRNSGV